MEPDQPSVVAGSTTTVKTLADGTLRISVDIEPRHAQAAFTMFGSPGTPVAVARLVPEAAQKAAQQENAPKGQGWGHVYQDLYRLGWFHNPRVIEAFGVQGAASPDVRIELIKQAVYVEFGIESLTQLEPQYLVRMCESLGIHDTLPSSVRDAARGRPV